MSVNQYRLSKLAIADLESIWSYTNENWSKEQADDYIKFIYSKINLLSVNPEIG